MRGFCIYGDRMIDTGKHNHSLFAGLDGNTPKTFSIEVRSCSALVAINAMEKAIAELKLRQLQFGYENEAGVKAFVRYS